MNVDTRTKLFDIIDIYILRQELPMDHKKVPDYSEAYIIQFHSTQIHQIGLPFLI